LQGDITEHKLEPFIKHPSSGTEETPSKGGFS